jgi:hypothetical protein
MIHDSYPVPAAGTNTGPDSCAFFEYCPLSSLSLDAPAQDYTDDQNRGIELGYFYHEASWYNWNTSADIDPECPVPHLEIDPTILYPTPSTLAATILQCSDHASDGTWDVFHAPFPASGSYSSEDLDFIRSVRFVHHTGQSSMNQDRGQNSVSLNGTTVSNSPMSISTSLRASDPPSFPASPVAISRLARRHKCPQCSTRFTHLKQLR